MPNLDMPVAWMTRSLDDAGYSLVPVRNRRGAFSVVADGRKVTLALLSSNSPDRFSVAIMDTRERHVLASRSQVPFDPRMEKDLEDVVGLLRAKAVLDGRLDVRDFPTDHGLRTWLAWTHSSSPDAGEIAAEIHGRMREMAGEPFVRQAALDLHAIASNELPTTGHARHFDLVLREATDACGDFQIARMRHILRSGSWAAAFLTRVPEWRPSTPRTFEDGASPAP